MNYKRSDKVAEAVHEFISGLLIKGLKDPRIGFVTITGVKVTDDLHLATVYYSVIGADDEKKSSEKALNSAKGFIRKEMGRSLRLRYVPDIIFRYDDSMDYAQRIESIIHEININKGPDDTEDNQ
ncbi:MAG TPA: ribosome-binding factor A [Geobacteraceae bacterium]|nr:ribosome-binding factor A [Geobacteraceae bacterium]